MIPLKGFWISLLFALSACAPVRESTVATDVKYEDYSKHPIVDPAKRKALIAKVAGDMIEAMPEIYESKGALATANDNPEVCGKKDELADIADAFRLVGKENECMDRMLACLGDPLHNERQIYFVGAFLLCEPREIKTIADNLYATILNSVLAPSFKLRVMIRNFEKYGDPFPAMRSWLNGRFAEFARAATRGQESLDLERLMAEGENPSVFPGIDELSIEEMRWAYALALFSSQRPIDGLQFLDRHPSLRARALETRTFYMALHESNLIWARKYFKAHAAHTNVYAWTPASYAPYTYTELYAQDLCPGGLSNDAEFSAFEALNRTYIDGKLSADELRVQVTAHMEKYGRKADTLSLLAGPLLLEKKYHDAARLYWEAFKKCPFYGIAYKGYSQAVRRFRFEQTGMEEQLLVIAAGISDAYDAQLKRYIQFSDRLNDVDFAAIKIGMSFWLPFLEEVIEAGHSATVILPSMKTSDDLRITDYRDRRVEQGIDLRLFDDIRGTVDRETNIVVVGYEGIFGEEPRQPGRSFTHEFAHQYHEALGTHFDL